MTTLKFLWIDDDKARERFKRSLESYKYGTGANSLKAEVEFLILHKVDTLQTIDKFKRFSNFDLILIDHVLTSAIGTIRKGTTVAEIIRESVPNCPIIGITAVKNKDSLDLNVLSIYDSLFFIGELGDSLSSIFTIASTFKVLNRKRIGNDLNRIAALFAPPKDDVQLLMKILPPAALNLNIQRSNVRMLARWTLHKLIAKPGLLFSRCWAANLAGIKESSFRKIEKLFVNSKYKGIFCNNENPRWWKSILKENIFRFSTNKKSNLPWEAGHFLPGISKRDYSVCRSCGELFPETMGYLDTTEKSPLVPLHYRHSQPHISYKRELFFDEIVVMKDVNK